MTDIEQILLEIEKHLAECWECTPKNDFIKGRVHEAKHLSEFIKTIPIFKVGQTIVPKNHQERGLTITDIRDGRYYSHDLEICPIVEQHEWEIEKKPSDELEKAAEEHAKILYGDNWMKSEYTQDSGFRAISNFKAGAKWQEENDNICYEEIFEEGASWKYEQMTKDAVILHDELAMCYNGDVPTGLSPYEEWWEANEVQEKFKDGDKVKVIILKDNEPK